MSGSAHVPRIPRIAAGTAPDDRAWATGSLLGLRRAQDGGAVAQGTAVRLAHDGEAFYVRFDCDDADIWATHVRRDAPLWDEEVVELFVAPGDGVPVEYFEIEVNPLGTIFDARVVNPDGRRDTMRVDPSWDAAGLLAKVTRPAAGVWRVDIAIPWIAICPGARPSTWRANFFRVERPRGGVAEYSCWWPTYADPPDFHKPAHFGRLVLG